MTASQESQSLSGSQIETYVVGFWHTFGEMKKYIYILCKPPSFSCIRTNPLNIDATGLRSELMAAQLPFIIQHNYFKKNSLSWGIQIIFSQNFFISEASILLQLILLNSWWLMLPHTDFFFCLFLMLWVVLFFSSGNSSQLPFAQNNYFPPKKSFTKIQKPAYTTCSAPARKLPLLFPMSVVEHLSSAAARCFPSGTKLELHKKMLD